MESWGASLVQLYSRGLNAMMFTLEQALKAQEALREAANLAPEQFPLGAFVGMLSDEIETLRKQGKTDEEITRLINESTGAGISVSDIKENYASPEERHKG